MDGRVSDKCLESEQVSLWNYCFFLLLLFFVFVFCPYCTACGTLVPQPGIETFLAVKVRSPNHWATREFPGIMLLWSFFAFTHGEDINLLELERQRGQLVLQISTS